MGWREEGKKERVSVLEIVRREEVVGLERGRKELVEWREEGRREGRKGLVV